MEPRLEDWIGRVSEQRDVVSGGAVRGMLATTACKAVEPVVGDTAPLLTHWLHFVPAVPFDQIGPDGHPRRGDFLPDIDLPRRMWAGSALRFVRPLRIGSTIMRRSKIASVAKKEGRSGRLVFVRVEHEISDDGGLVLLDQQDIVYRDASQPGVPNIAVQEAPVDPQWTRRILPDPVLLFRYSALTFNSHRIHYDRDYAMTEEGYPGLVVHGPLIATLLLHELVTQHPGAQIADYRFRAVKPIFDIQSFFICGSIAPDGSAHLFARDEAGTLCMDATATLE